MKPLAISILVLSLAGNAVLGFLVFRPGANETSPAQQKAAPSSVATSSGKAAETAAATTEPSRSAAPSPATWQALNAGADLRTTIANLRAAGFPPEVIRAVVERRVWEDFRERYAAVAPPYWKRYSPTPEQIAAKQRLDSERKETVDSLLGEEERPSASMSAEDRRARYGDLPDDKVDEVARIDRDYEEVAHAARAGTTKNMMDRFNETRDQQILLEQQRLADLATVLTPEELEEYKRHNSIAASRAMGRLHAVDVTEAEYEQVYRAEESYDDATSKLKMVGTIDSDTLAKQTAALNAFNDRVQEALGDDRFYQYLEASDWRYAQMKKSMSAYPSVTPAATYELARLQQDIQVGLSTIYDDKTLTQAQREARRNQMMSSASAKLDALLGPDVAAAYKKDGPGKQFNFTPTPMSGGG